MGVINGPYLNSVNILLSSTKRRTSGLRSITATISTGLTANKVHVGTTRRMLTTSVVRVTDRRAVTGSDVRVHGQYCTWPVLYMARYRSVWPGIDQSGPVLISLGQYWSCLASIGHVWPCLASIGHVWPVLISLGQY